jgi:hypothetical protein
MQAHLDARFLTHLVEMELDAFRIEYDRHGVEFAWLGYRASRLETSQEVVRDPENHLAFVISGVEPAVCHDVSQRRGATQTGASFEEESPGSGAAGADRGGYASRAAAGDDDVKLVVHAVVHYATAFRLVC